MGSLVFRSQPVHQVGLAMRALEHVATRERERKTGAIPHGSAPA